MSHPENLPLAKLAPAERLAVLRIIDANSNRAAEGLRVVEEYARFGLDDRFLTEQAKGLRHKLVAALQGIATSERMAARETLADVGTNVTIAGEYTRASLNQVCSANWQRVCEALRVLEEYGKLLLAPEEAAAIEACRYEAYTLAKAWTTVADGQTLLVTARLYVLIECGSSEETFATFVKQLIAAGVHVIQLRDKQASDQTLLTRGKLLRKLLTEAKSAGPNSVPLFIMNDRPDLALLTQADGVHVGQEELSFREVRQVVGPTMLVGVSTHDLGQARQAVLHGASYLGCGPTFPSGTKSFTTFPGLEFLRQVAAEISLPAFAIGGINATNLPQVLASGFRRIAVSGAIAGATNPAAEVQRLLAGLGSI